MDRSARWRIWDSVGLRPWRSMRRRPAWHIRISSHSGKMPTPTSPSSSLRKPNTPSFIRSLYDNARISVGRSFSYGLSAAKSVRLQPLKYGFCSSHTDSLNHDINIAYSGRFLASIIGLWLISDAGRRPKIRIGGDPVTRQITEVGSDAERSRFGTDDRRISQALDIGLTCSVSRLG